MNKDLFAPVVRVSTEKQAQRGYSLETQLDVVCNAIRLAGGEPHPEIVLKDDGFSGDNWDRPSVREGLALIRSGKIKGLAFFDTDRAGRDVHGTLGHCKEVRKAGGRIVFADIGEYRDDAEFLLTLNLKLSIGEYAKHKTKALSRAATLRKVRNGETHGLPPYGYRREAKTKSSPERFIVVPEQARIVVSIYTWYAQEGLSLRAIGRRLMAQGIPPPRKRWNATTLRKILTSETYLGIWHYNKNQFIEPQTIRSTGPRHRRRTSKKARPRSEWEGVSVDPIVSQELFDAAAARMSSNLHTLGGRPSATYRAKGVICCPLCNSRFVGQRNHGRPRYQCSNAYDRITSKRKCLAPTLGVAATDSAILGAIEDALGDERQLAALIAKHRSELVADGNTSDVKHVRKRLEQIKRREEKARAEALKAAEIVDVDAERFYDGEVREARAQRIELQSQLRAKTVVVDFRVDVKAIAAGVRKGLRLATPEQQQKLIQGVTKRVIPSLDAKEIEIEFAIPVSGDAQYCKQQQPDAGQGIEGARANLYPCGAGRFANASDAKSAGRISCAGGDRRPSRGGRRICRD